MKNGLGGRTNAAVWFFAAVVGAAVSAVLLVILRKAKLAKLAKAQH